MNKIRKDIALNTHERNIHVHIFGSLALNSSGGDLDQDLDSLDFKIAYFFFFLFLFSIGLAERRIVDTFTIRFGEKTSRSWVTKNANTMLRR